MAEPIIRIDHVARTYHVGDMDVHALRDVSLTINAGEFVAIMGSSGSGKSTLMAVLGCLDRPSSGHYFFEGTDVAGLSEPERARLRSERLGFVFQSFNLLSRTSAIENVALPLFYAASGPASATARVSRARAALKLLGLGDRERNTPGQLSGGQQQRVAIARALINAPGLLLADEPTGNLDTRTSHEIMETLTRLNREQGVTIIVVTHEADIARLRRSHVDHARRPHRLRCTKSQTYNHRRAAARGTGGRGGRACAADRHPPPAIRPHAVWAFGLMIMAAAMQALWRNMMRSALTMLGVFIGVAALIAMVAVGQGANEAVRKQIESLGTNLVVVLPGARTMGGMRGGFGSASTVTTADAQAIRRESMAVERGQLSDPSVGPDPVRQSELDHANPGHRPELSADDELANRRRPRNHRRGRRVGRTGGGDRPDGRDAAVRRGAKSDRRADPGEKRADAGNRRARRQGADAFRHRSGRPGDGPVHHRGAQGAGRGRAEPGSKCRSTGTIRPHPTLTA